MDRIPLEKRLRQCGASGNALPAAAMLYVDVYCGHLSRMGNDQSYWDFFLMEAEKGDCGDIRNKFIAQLAYEALYGGLPEETGTELLYRLLAAPFGDRNIFNEKGGQKK